LIQDYVKAARIAWDAGADFVDIKHCHGYLLHEFLSARSRPGPYGGSFENRTRVLREIVAGIRASGNMIDVGVRLSAFDFVPFKPDPTRTMGKQLGPGVPEDYPKPYVFAFGANPARPTEPDLTEAVQFSRLCIQLGVKILNLSAGSPYYNPHIQRPAAYPPSDGYQPPEDPIVGVARQINAVREIRAALCQPTFAHPGTLSQASGQGKPPLLLVGSAYSYLQEYLPHVAQFIVRNQWTDLVGLGRIVLSYPEFLAEVIKTGSWNPKLICRTFSDCTTAPRNGLVSGCYPLDKYYAGKPEAQDLKAVKNKPKP
jgi:2,4-dienoyl-CoA reductase-like NADH-dependent reductase (Old Yellow Enzyme family)